MTKRAMLGLLCAGVALGLLAGAAQAKLTTMGSNLSAPANMAEAHGADSVFWSITLAGGARTRVPAYGQITRIRMKGMVLTNTAPPLTGGNFAALRPNRDGSVTIRQRSQPIDIPSSGDPNQITT